VTLNGGVLATDRQFVRDGSTNAGTGVGNFKFNGGTLRALGAQPDWLRSFDTANFLGLSAVTVQAGGAVIDSNGFDVGINTALAHDATLGASLDGGLKKLGAGTLTLGGTNSYTGTTVVSGGTLLVNGSLSGSTTTVSSGILGGTGSVTGVTVNSGSSLLGGDGVTPADDLAVGGDLSLQDGSIVRLTLGATGAHSSLTRTAGTWSFDLDQKFLFTDAGATPGLYDNIISGLAANPGTTGTWTIGNPGWIGTFSYDGAGGVDLNLASVPEPRVALTLVAGVPFLFGRRRRRAPAA